MINLSKCIKVKSAEHAQSIFNNELKNIPVRWVFNKKFFYDDFVKRNGDIYIYIDGKNSIAFQIKDDKINGPYSINNEKIKDIKINLSERIVKMNSKLQTLLEMKKLINKEIITESRKSKRPARMVESMIISKYDFGILMTVDTFMDYENIDDINDIKSYGYEILKDIDKIDISKDYILVNFSFQAHDLNDALSILRDFDIDSKFNMNILIAEEDHMSDKNASSFMDNLVDIEGYDPKVTIAYIFKNNAQLSGTKNIDDLYEFNIVAKSNDINESKLCKRRAKRMVESDESDLHKYSFKLVQVGADSFELSNGLFTTEDFDVEDHEIEAKNLKEAFNKLDKDELCSGLIRFLKADMKTDDDFISEYDSTNIYDGFALFDVKRDGKLITAPDSRINTENFDEWFEEQKEHDADVLGYDEDEYDEDEYDED